MLFRGHQKMGCQLIDSYDTLHRSRRVRPAANNWQACWHSGSPGAQKMAESLQHKLDRVRSPRVHITYDVETGGAIEKKELPFVMGVFGDFTGMPEEPLPQLKDRKFVEVNPDNFDA